MNFDQRWIYLTLGTGLVGYALYMILRDVGMIEESKDEPSPEIPQQRGVIEEVFFGYPQTTIGEYIVDGEIRPSIEEPKDDPENQASDEFVLVRGDFTAAAQVWAVGGFDATDFRNRAEAYQEQHGFSDPFASTIFAFHKDLFPNLSPYVVRAVLEVENSFHDPARETYEANVKDYSVGLMQIRCDTCLYILDNLRMKATKDQVRVWLKDPTFNIGCGMLYLERQRRRYAASDLFQPDVVFAAYNAGSARYNFVRKLFSNQEYVNRCLNQWDRFRNYKTFDVAVSGGSH